ncbi:VMA21-like domain containing protein [Cryptosporidium tyzzeri]|nr:VMA21-like domain containing protein [Cryptosporidium tyzzeri]
MSKEQAKSIDSCVGPAPFGISKVLKESSNKKVLTEFVLFTISLVFLPCGLFFFSPIFLRKFLPEQSISVVSAVFSVILVNIICGIYVYR